MNICRNFSSLSYLHVHFPRNAYYAQAYTTCFVLLMECISFVFIDKLIDELRNELKGDDTMKSGGCASGWECKEGTRLLGEISLWNDFLTMALLMGKKCSVILTVSRTFLRFSERCARILPKETIDSWSAPTSKF